MILDKANRNYDRRARHTKEEERDDNLRNQSNDRSILDRLYPFAEMLRLLMVTCEAQHTSKSYRSLKRRMLDFACDATYPRTAVGPGLALRAAADAALSHCRTGAVVAHRVLLGGALASAGRVAALNNRQGKPLTVLQGAMLGYACGFLWYLRQLLLDLPDHVFVRRTREASRRRHPGSLLPLPGAVPCSVRGSCLPRSGGRGLDFKARCCWRPLPGSRWSWPARASPACRGTCSASRRSITRCLFGLRPSPECMGSPFLIAAVNSLWLVRIRMRERRHTRTVLTFTGVVLVLLYIAVLRRVQPTAHVRPLPLPRWCSTTSSVGAQAGPPESAQQLLDSFSRLSLVPAGYALQRNSRAGREPVHRR